MEPLNKIISRHLFWAGMVVLAFAFTHQILGTPKPLLNDWGWGVMIASLSYRLACFTENSCTLL
jgi:hypothetical protein